MVVKIINPITPGQRWKSVTDFSFLTTRKPEKSLLVPLKSTGGRNSDGKRTMRYRGGGHKRMYRLIDFKRRKVGVKATVKSIEYDPCRSAFIALLNYEDGQKSYILAPDGLDVGKTVMSGDDVDPEIGNALKLKKIPNGILVHNIELVPGCGGVLARSAGMAAKIVAKTGKFVTLKLPSKEVRMVPGDCMATVGVVSNIDHINVKIGKAGRNRWFGIRPRVRAVAMNPVDHPMGGGEGKASGGHPRSESGMSAKGFKTRKKKKISNLYIVSRRKK
jgi:large subunit ribosomal protein L2